MKSFALVKWKEYGRPYVGSFARSDAGWSKFEGPYEDDPDKRKELFDRTRTLQKASILGQDYCEYIKPGTHRQWELVKTLDSLTRNARTIKQEDLPWRDLLEGVAIESALDGNYYVITPYNRGFTASLKGAVPARHRQWDPGYKAWIIPPEFLDDVQEQAEDVLGRELMVLRLAGRELPERRTERERFIRRDISRRRR